MNLLRSCLVASACAVAWFAALAAAQNASRPAQGGSRSLDYWLNSASEPGTSQPARAGERAGTATPPGADSAPGDMMLSRDDSLPGAIQTSDGKVVFGRLFSTRDRMLEVYDSACKLWRRVPLEAVLSITAVVDEEAMELEWRWKAMGEPEKTYTGRSYPTRRLSWKFRLIDGEELTGAVKGAPLWVDDGRTRIGPLVLAERTKGDMGQKLSDLVYMKRLVISRRLADQLLRRRVDSP